MTMGPSQCSRCGGELEYDREVEQEVRHGDDVALLRVRADVCTRCGEVLLHPGMTDRMVRAKKMLQESPAKARVVGRVYDLRSFEPP
jgi:YgiT-type zinc finger domain-containing protein